MVRMYLPESRLAVTVLVCTDISDYKYALFKVITSVQRNELLPKY